ncbi:hypothetical protein A3A14_03355 [Candidatus Daviesbacteria bacterium RIFCSPLOWO2_01_FULL_43_38]|uniref:Uncharacterized protein n=2 Tax=Candidatus Daviesiibacteriota TaxID=1752718 RepID=A0A1F5K760_9BACT|nr:MAG: hypothetical protein A2874_01980 [Candidatus Daviesbacteria bacterium RIFCSPHIGHO2_01_FULL_43_17]OGE36762.1 MAG: hypothetical protein A3E45_01400 [Candidatus Daviesbacteria bacterium RIFCSPHIGHO2_12_FULL_43_11]OGE63680.1 MAG: hypothetical protein A3A14_03355 [Candidatus Daviesbacteria bacterium RIFCSPLOWO2_01_FULL_43_38]
MQFFSKKPHYEYLRKKWLAKHKDVSEKLLASHGQHLRNITLGGLGGLMLLSTPGVNVALHAGELSAHEDGITKAEDKNVLLVAALKGHVPEEMRKLTDTEDEAISKILSEKLKMQVEPELEGIRLNRTYGMIGGEQHLYRYPGDNLYKHAGNASDWAMYGPAGIAPGLGAWGHFAPSEAAFDENDKERERYYLAVQTFLAPGFAENVGKYRDFFKFRKMLVANPKTGQAVVAVIGDAGPAAWTGKHLGGSPEVMHFVGLAGGPRKGAVLYYFIDDPKDEIPLGPINMKGGRVS